MIEKHGHGGDIWTASELYGIDKNQFLDFSSNMNPLGPHPAVGRVLREEWQRELSRYPDPDCRELRARIAELYRVPANSILIGNGAAELIDLAVRVLRPRTVGLLRPCFAEYEEAAERAGAAIIDLPLREEDGFLPGAAAGPAAAHGKPELHFLGHPNNPTGKLLPVPYVKELLNAGSSLILDEAFIDFSENEEETSFIRQAPVTDRLMVVRSMTKFYTIPGLRLGFIVAHPDRIRQMKKLQVQWSVNALAQRIGLEVLGDRAFEQATREWLLAERPRLRGGLAALGLQVADSAANYLLFKLPPEMRFTVRELQAAMARRGVLIRDASTFKGLDRRYGRTAVKLRGDNDKLVDTMADTIRELQQQQQGQTDC